MKNTRIYQMVFADIYPLYLQKIERKGRTQEDLNCIIYWLTGYDEQGLSNQINEKSTMEQFFDKAPMINDNLGLIKGMICGYRVEEIEEPLMHKIRCLDKLVDELAKGKSITKILRSTI